MPSSPSTYMDALDVTLNFPRQAHYVLTATAPLVVCADAREVAPLASTAEAIRAIWLARARATTWAGRRPSSVIIQGYLSGRARALLTTESAPTMSRRRG